MRNISPKNLPKLAWARQRGIDPDVLVKKYGIRFFIELIDYLTKAGKNGPRTREIIYPQIKSFKWSDKSKVARYYDELEDAGFRIKIKPEDFIDEDDGQIISVPRRHLYYLKK